MLIQFDTCEEAERQHTDKNCNDSNADCINDRCGGDHKFAVATDNDPCIISKHGRYDDGHCAATEMAQPPKCFLVLECQERNSRDDWQQDGGEESSVHFVIPVKSGDHRMPKLAGHNNPASEGFGG